jgi:hypothetical protein
VKSEREPALPKPLPRSVSPWTMRTFSIGTPNTSTASWRIAGLDALAHLLRRREDLDEAVGRDVDRDLLLEGDAAGPLEESGDAAAAQLAARLRGLAAAA